MGIIRLRKITLVIAILFAVAASCATEQPGAPELPWNVSTFAGACGTGVGAADGPRSSASFYLPVGVDVDDFSRVVIADVESHTIRAVSGNTVSTLAGSTGMAGADDGVGANARFRMPFDVAIAPSGVVYVSDTGNHTIREIALDGEVSTLAGSPGQTGSADGSGSTARFNEPAGIALGHDGDLYVADRGNGTVRVVTPTGDVSTLAGLAGAFGHADGAGSAARFSRFNGIDVDSDGNIWVADTNNVTIRKVTPTGTVTTFAGAAGQSAPVDGVGSAARFDFPYQIAIDSADNIFVADGDSTIRKIEPTGSVTTPVGVANSSGCVDGVGSAARLYAPQGIAIDGRDRLLVADTGNSIIRRVITR